MKPARTAGALCLVLLFSLLAPALAAAVPPGAEPASAPGDREEEPAEEDLVEYEFTLMHTNDEHSALIPHSPAADHRPGQEDGTVGGISRLATAVQEVRAARDEPVLLLGAGDMVGETPIAWLNLVGHSPELELLLQLEYDALTLGNHEFDFGPHVLAQMLQRAGYPDRASDTPVLASNTQVPDEHPLADVGLQDTAVLELENGLTVGLMGLVGEDAALVTRDPSPAYFTNYIDTARLMEERLRQEKGVDLVVALSHSGLEEDVDLAGAVPGIDIIVGGHCHTALERPLQVGDTYILQAGERLRHLGVADFTYRPEEDRLYLRNPVTDQPYLEDLDHQVPPDEQMQEALEPYRQELDALLADLTDDAVTEALQPVAASDFPLDQPRARTETPLGNFVTDALRQVTGQATGEPVDVAIQADGQIRGELLPSREGEIAAYDLLERVGLGSGPDGRPGYPVASFYLSGEELRRTLEISALLSEVMGDSFFFQSSGVEYTYDPARSTWFTIPFWDIPVPSTRAVEEAYLVDPEGQRLQPLEWGDDQLYHVATDTYLLYFLPLIGDLVPDLMVTPRDSQGEPLRQFEKTLVPSPGFNGQPPDQPQRPGERSAVTQELKVWEAVLQFALDQPPGEDGLPQIEDRYAGTEGRINLEPRPHPLRDPALALLLVGGATWLLLRRQARRKRASRP